MYLYAPILRLEEKSQGKNQVSLSYGQRRRTFCFRDSSGLGTTSPKTGRVAEVNCAVPPAITVHVVSALTPITWVLLSSVGFLKQMLLQAVAPIKLPLTVGQSVSFIALWL